jgi:hypothetical protein
LDHILGDFGRFFSQTYPVTLAETDFSRNKGYVVFNRFASPVINIALLTFQTFIKSRENKIAALDHPPKNQRTPKSFRCDESGQARFGPPTIFTQ